MIEMEKMQNIDLANVIAWMANKYQQSVNRGKPNPRLAKQLILMIKCNEIYQHKRNETN